LRWALDVDAKDPVVNRQAALAHRVEQAKPGDEEAQQSISRLSVEKTIHQGGYDPALLGSSKGADAPGAKSMSVARYSRGAAAEAPEEEDADILPLEERLKAAIEKDPAAIEQYFSLADLYLQQQRMDDAQQVLDRASQASGGGNLQVRERLEDLQLRRVARQAAAAQQHFEHEQTAEARQLFDRARAQANQVELEVYAARVDRDPHNPRLQFELGMRLKKAGKAKQAITAFQAARSDPRRRALVLLELGECFQKIEQYKLALYRAGVLATGLRELDRAERHLADLAGLDYGYRDVADRLDKLAQLRDSG
jgi:tetratricopeptide (TPR) repeat protein